MPSDIDIAVDRLRDDLRDSVKRMECSHADHVELVTAQMVENSRQVGKMREEQSEGFRLLNGRIRVLEEWKIRHEATRDERRRVREEIEGHIVSRRQFMLGVGSLLVAIGAVIFDRIAHVL